MTRPKIRPWTTSALRVLHRGSDKGTPVRSLARILGRTEGAIRQKARNEGLSVGKHQRGVSTSRLRSPRRRRLGLSGTHASA